MLKPIYSISRGVLFEPADFFRRDFHRISLSLALALGLSTAWLVMVLSFIFSTSASLALDSLLSGWLEANLPEGLMALDPSEEARDFLLQAGALTLAPVLLVIELCLFSSVLFFFGKIFIQDQSQLNYRTCLKIAGLCLVSAWLWLVPVFGGLVGAIAFFTIAIIGVREIFWVSTKRAALVVLTPQLILLFLLSLLAIGALAMMAAWAQLEWMGFEYY